MKRTHYYLSQFFPSELKKLVDRKEDFETTRTSYTKTIKTDNYKILFNPDGDTDDRVLSLINKVRNDSKLYMESHNVTLPDTKILFIDMFDIPDSDEVIYKVDLTSAYWKKSLLDGIVTEETDDYLKSAFSDSTQKQIKSIRLKALGSLATRKEYEKYEQGISVEWEAKSQPTKKLYMNVCRSVDKTMQECKANVNGCVFYYWDCMFVKKEFSNQVIDFFRSKQFECKFEETRLQYERIGTKGYFISEVDGKMYMVESENRNLLNNIPHLNQIAQ